MENDPILALEQALIGCDVVALDSADTEGACSVVTPEGRFLKLSGTAAYLATEVRTGTSLEALAAATDHPRAQVESTCRSLAARLAAMRDAPERPVAAGFTLRREWLASRTVRALARPLVPLCTPAVMIVVGVLAVVWVAVELAHAPATQMTVGTFWIAYAISLAVLFAHELGHAATCLRHGAAVGPIGIALYLIYPAMYCDVTGAWRLRRWQRVAIDLGGLYIQALVTAGIVAAWRLTGSPVLYAVAWMSVGLGITNLIPFFTFDGYWCLSDMLGVVNLGDQRRALLGRVWARLRGRPGRASPWPAATTAIVAVYSIAALGFGIYVTVRFTPRGLRQLASVPGYARDLWLSVWGGHGAAAAASFGRLVTAVAIGVFVVMMLRNLALSGWRRAFARRTT